MKRDRARTKILRTSPFGLIEMTRQRIRPSLKRSVYRDCPGCAGTGVVKTAESMAIEVMRLLILATQQQIAKVTVTVSDDVASYLNNKKRGEIAKLEQDSKIAVQVLGLEHVFARASGDRVSRRHGPRGEAADGVTTRGTQVQAIG